MTNVVVDVVKELLFRNRDRRANPVLDGPLRPNSLLDECPVLNASLREPDDIVFSREGAAYVTCGHQIIRFADADFIDPTVVADFKGLATGLARHPQGGVVACVSGQGVMFIDGPENGRSIGFETVKGLTCPTSLVVAPEGEIYVCDASLENSPDRWVYDLMTKGHSGRVLRIDSNTNEVSIIADGLAYPSGICFSLAGDSLVVSEAWAHGLLRIPLRRPGMGIARREDVMQNLPGYPGRIIPFKSGYCLTIFALRTQLIDFVLTEDSFRRKMIERIAPEFWIAPALRSDGHYLEPVQGGGLKKHGSLKAWAPPRSYGLVVFLDSDFEPETSLHSRVGGSTHGITGVADHDGKIFLAVKGGDKIVREMPGLVQ